MKIGHLHSWKQKDMWKDYDAIMIRHQWETWDYAGENNVSYWGLKYGKGSDREKLRDLIYQHTNLDFLHLAKNYDLIFLSMNFDHYPSSEQFRFFVNEIVYTYKTYYPNKEIIVGAGNETFEKRGTAQKVYETAYDTYYACKEAGIPNPRICFWNEKIRTEAERKALMTLMSEDGGYAGMLQHYCTYFGYQSLGTEPETIRFYKGYADRLGIEMIDVEVMTETERFSEIKLKVDTNELLGFPVMFLGCPTVTKQCADFNKMFAKYGLKIGDKEKDKFKVVQYSQQFREDEQEEKVNKMLNDIIFEIVYVYGTKGIGVKRIQKILKLWFTKYHPEYFKEHLLEVNGIYDIATNRAVAYFQKDTGLLVDGKAGKQTNTELLKFLLDRAEYYK